MLNSKTYLYSNSTGLVLSAIIALIAKICTRTRKPFVLKTHSGLHNQKLKLVRFDFLCLLI